MPAALGSSTQRGFAGQERSQIVQCVDLGRTGYADALRWQSQRSDSVAHGTKPEVIALQEHDPIYTQGRRGGREHVLQPLSAPVVDTDRGGDITFHDPGQLVVWPILRLRARGIGIEAYVRALEEIAIQVAESFGVAAGRVRGRPGVWVESRKLASVGVRLQSGVSRHGLALNCDTDLRWFSPIRACGIADVTVTSLSREAGFDIGVDDCRVPMVEALSDVLGLRLSPMRQKADRQ